MLEQKGAFCCFTDVSANYDRNINGANIIGRMDFARILSEQSYIAVVLDISLGFDKNIRSNFACSLKRVAKGIDRIQEWLSH